MAPATSAFSSFGTPTPPAQRGYRGLFVNLDRSTDRRMRLEDQLRQYDLLQRYERLSAIDAASIHARPNALSPAQQACFLSHQAGLRKAKDFGTTIHVIEDDVLLSHYTESAILALQDAGAFNGFDIVFTETILGPDVMTLRQLKQSFDDFIRTGGSRYHVHDVTTTYSASFSSYLVAPASLDRVLAVLKRGQDEGPALPIDLLARREGLNGRLRLGCIFPFVTSVQFGNAVETTITDRNAPNAKLSIEVFDLLRYSFFVGRDLDGMAKPTIDKLRARAREWENDPHHKVLSDVLGFVVSSKEFSVF